MTQPLLLKSYLGIVMSNEINKPKSTMNTSTGNFFGQAHCSQLAERSTICTHPIISYNLANELESNTVSSAYR